MSVISIVIAVMVGVLSALLCVRWRQRSARAQWMPALAGVLMGLLAWGAVFSVAEWLRRSESLWPDVQLSLLDGRPIALEAYAGKPVVVNLWATWCAPCRREMPVFQQAQSAFPEITFVMLNQGEQASAIQGFLTQEGLAFKHVLRDPFLDMMRIMKVRGLPSTLFFDSHGRLVEMRMGELTMASLKDTISYRYAQELGLNRNNQE